MSNQRELRISLKFSLFLPIKYAKAAVVDKGGGMKINGYSSFFANCDPAMRPEGAGERARDAAAASQAGAVAGAFGNKAPGAKDVRATTKAEKGPKVQREKARSATSDVKDHVEISSFARSKAR